MTCGIYTILNLKTGGRYIGSSCNIEARWKDHRLHLRGGRHGNRFLQRAWNKYGESSFGWVILEACREEDLLEREQSYLPEEKTRKALRGNNLYNELPIAGSPKNYVTPRTMTEEEKRKSSLRMKGNRIWVGRKHSEETKRKMSQKAMGNKSARFLRGKPSKVKGRKMSEDTRRKMSEAKKEYWRKRKGL